MTAQPFDPQQITRDLQEFSRRLSRGLGALAQAPDVAIGSAEKDAIYTLDKLVVYHYRPFADVPAAQQVRTPLVICYALVNRPYMMDLQADRSLIQALLRRGVDIYLIDWGYPDGADRYRGIDDYVLRYLPACVDFVRQATQSQQVNLLGVCQGGTLSLCFAALQPDRVRNLITMVTPVDFRTPENLLTKWSEHVDFDALVATTGNVPGEMLNALFLGLLPFRLTSQKYMELLDHIDDPQAVANFLRMEKWIFDSPDQPGEMFKQFMCQLVRENRLVKGTFTVNGQTVDLKKITMPVLNIYAAQDHLVPPSASKPIERLVGSQDYSSYEFPGGHIGIYVSGAAHREVPSRIAEWLRHRDR